jgi:hypothetical protein
MVEKGKGKEAVQLEGELTHKDQANPAQASQPPEPSEPAKVQNAQTGEDQGDTQANPRTATDQGDKGETQKTADESDDEPQGRGHFEKEDPRVLLEVRRSNADGPLEGDEAAPGGWVVATPIQHDGQPFTPRQQVSASDFGGEEALQRLVEAGAVVPKVDEEAGEEVWVNYHPADNRPAPDDVEENPGNAQVRYTTLTDQPQVTNVPEDQKDSATAPAGPDASHAAIANPAKAGDTRAAR